MKQDRLQCAPLAGPGCRPDGPSPSVSSAAAASIPRAELETIIRRHIRCDASGLAPAVAGLFLCGFEEAAGAIIERLSRASDERAERRDLQGLGGDSPASAVDGANSDGEAPDLIDELDDAASVLRSNDAPCCADAVDQAAQAISDLIKERDALRQALRPFADAVYDAGGIMLFSNTQPSRADWLRARTLLSQSSEGE